MLIFMHPRVKDLIVDLPSFFSNSYRMQLSYCFKQVLMIKNHQVYINVISI